MSGWQDWIVLLVLVLCVLRIGGKIYFSIRKMKRKQSLCDSCSGGCCHCSGASNAKWSGKSASLTKKTRKVVVYSCRFGKKHYLCTRNPKEELVPWMSGLVSGLQNRVRRFESARYLNK